MAIQIKAHFTSVVMAAVAAFTIVTAPANAEMIRQNVVPITGQVRDAGTKQPLREARVELWRAGVPIDRQYTNHDGRFRFAQTAAGSYMLTIDSNGYQQVAIEIEVPSSAFIGVIYMGKADASPRRDGHVVPITELLAPSNVRKEFDRARQEAKRDCAKAIPHFEKGLRGFAQDASAYNDLGNCYRKLGNLDRAEESFKRARALSDSIYVALNLAELYSTQKRFKEAEATLLEFIQKQPAAGDAYYGLSLVYTAAGEVDRAETAALQAHTYRHAIADVHLVLATIYANRNQQGDSRRELELYLKEAPKGSMANRVRELLKTQH